MRVLFLDPFHGGSHAAVAQGFARHSRHEVELLTLSIAGGWRWRMRGAAVTFARMLRERTERRAEAQASGRQFDCIVATDILDLATFLGLARELTAGVPVALYFHENQLTYPLPPGRTRDLAFPWINYTSALAADALFFNSAFHRSAFLAALPTLPGRYHDHRELDLIDAIAAKAQVLPPGIDLVRLDLPDQDKQSRRHGDTEIGDRGQGTGDRGSPPSVPPPAGGGRRAGVDERQTQNSKLKTQNCSPSPLHPLTPSHAPPIILWNSRWEYDKGPQAFFAALRALAARGVEFRLIVLGEHIDPQAPEFVAARAEFAPRIIAWGYAPDIATYRRLLWQADVVVSTAIQEFFGISVVEALYCGCVPILPRRLSYPELLPPELHAACLYDDQENLVNQLHAALHNLAELKARDFRAIAAQYDWSRAAPRYDDAFERMCR